MTGKPAGADGPGPRTSELPLQRVVVIDDDQHMRELYQLLFEELVDDDLFRIAGLAGSGREGIRLAAQLKPDLILSEAELPFEDGLAIVTEYRAAAPESLIVLTSSNPPLRAQADALAAGADAYLDKAGWGAQRYVEEIADILRARQQTCPRPQLDLREAAPAPARRSASEAAPLPNMRADPWGTPSR